MRTALERRRTSLETYSSSVPHLMELSVKRASGRLDNYIGKLEGLSPVGRLKSGFSYTSDESGKNIRSVSGVKPGDKLNIRVLDGEIHSTVTGTDSL
jgi:exodeoxyribonuclease VII large subunit